MARLIDLDEIKPMFFPSYEMDGLDVVRYLNTMPTVDAEEVVRCKDCVFCHYNSSNETYKCSTMNGMYRTVEPNEFCAYGERKIDDLRA